MKVLAFNGSPRVIGNTSMMLDKILNELNKNNIETELIHVGVRDIHGCVGCGKCRDTNPGRCVYNDDIINECIQKISMAQGVILGSPVYFGNMTSQMKAFIDRVGFASKPKGYLKNKVCASVAVARRNGSLVAFNGMNNLFTISESIIVSSNYWNQGVGNQVGDVLSDQEGIKTMKILGKNMSNLLHKIYGDKSE